MGGDDDAVRVLGALDDPDSIRFIGNGGEDQLMINPDTLANPVVSHKAFEIIAEPFV